jgi:hypothetical protein
MTQRSPRIDIGVKIFRRCAASCGLSIHLDGGASLAASPVVATSPGFPQRESAWFAFKVKARWIV